MKRVSTMTSLMGREQASILCIETLNRCTHFHRNRVVPCGLLQCSINASLGAKYCHSQPLVDFSADV